MVEDINYFDRLLATSKTLRYKLAILESKLSNLKRVRDAQSGLSSQARQIDEANKDLDSVVAEKTQHLKVKMSKLKTLMDKLEKSHSSEEEASDESNDRKRKQEIRSCAGMVTNAICSTYSLFFGEIQMFALELTTDLPSVSPFKQLPG